MNWFSSLFGPKDDSQSSAARYVIVSTIHDPKQPHKISVRVQLRGSSRVFTRSAVELYEDSIEDFSQKDAAYLALLAYKGKETSDALRSIHQKEYRPLFSYYGVFCMFYMSFLVLSNITTFKIIDLQVAIPFLDHFWRNPIYVGVGVLFFPFVNFICDIVTELYGFRYARVMILGGFACLFAGTLPLKLSLALPDSEVFLYGQEYTFIFEEMLRFFFASAMSYVVGALTNAFLLSRLKILTSGKYLVTRFGTSTMFGALADTFVFYPMIFLGQFPWSVLWVMIMWSWLVKMAVSLVLLPLSCVIVSMLRQQGKEDNVQPFKPLETHS